MLQHDIRGPAGAPVLVLSGSVGSTSDMWEPNLEALAARFLVIRLDHPGHGGSLTPPAPYRIDHLADDAVSTLNTLGINQFAWCGLSMGAMIGMVVGTRYPDRLTSLVLCCTSGRLRDTSVWQDRARRVNVEGTGALAAEIVGRWFTPTWARGHPREVERAQGWVATTSDTAYRWCCEAIANWDHVERLPSINAPTLVIAGKHDKATPVDPDARTLAERIPNARLEVLDAAHLATMEAPQEANELIKDHLSA